jgi:hypothetical protein
VSDNKYLMQKYLKSTADWLYQSPALDNDALPALQKELIKLYLHIKDRSFVPLTSTFFSYGPSPTERKHVFDSCPVLEQELLRLKLLDKFFFVAFVSVDTSKEFPPHVDDRVVGLNIPLLNCDDTYTVWYDAKILDQPFPDYVIGSEYVSRARITDKKHAVEIGRTEANRPLWIRTNVTHRPETHHDKFRLAASVRFHPEPVDENDNLWPHLIKQ